MRRRAFLRGCSSLCSLAIFSATIFSVSGPQVAQALPESPGHGFKKCEVIHPSGTSVRFTLYARHISCAKAIRIIHIYGRPDQPTYERGHNETCYRDHPGWCCAGGGGSVTCSNGNAVVIESSLPFASRAVGANDGHAAARVAAASSAVDVAVGRTLVECVTNSGATTRRARPRTCDFVKAGSPIPPFAYEEVYVTRLRWQHWGAMTTTAYGTWEGNMDARSPATVILSQPQACQRTGSPTYRHLTIHIHAPEYRTTISMRIEGCGGGARQASVKRGAARGMLITTSGRIGSLVFATYSDAYALGTVVTSAAASTGASVAGGCGPETIQTALGPTRVRFALRGHVSCAVAHHVVRNYFARSPGQCQGSGCYIRLPSGWRCLSEPGEVTAQTGHIAVCERGRASINTYEQES